MPAGRIDNTVNAIDRLRQRIACNQSSSRSFPDFVLRVLDPQADDVALDIGAGLGTQLLPVAERVRRAIGLDASHELVGALRARLAGRAGIVRADMDDLPSLDFDEPFSLIYAVYSIHYSGDPARVVRHAAALLRSRHARFVCVTPDVGNNEGWFADLRQLFDLPDGAEVVSRIGREVVLPALRDSFQTVDDVAYADTVRFRTLEALMAYYDACAPYCRTDMRAEARRYFGAKFEREGGYAITKRSVALVGRR